MRIATAGLLGLTLIGLCACHNKPTQPGGQAAAPAAAPVNLAANSMPQLKPGLWSQKMAMTGMAQAMPATQMCIDATTNQKMAIMGAQMSHKACQSGDIKHNLDGSWTASSTCDFGPGGKSVSTSTISGDFNSTYTVTVSSTTTGAAYAAANGSHQMTIQASWQGPCPAGWKGGDVSVNGMKMNVLGGSSQTPGAGG